MRCADLPASATPTRRAHRWRSWSSRGRRPPPSVGSWTITVYQSRWWTTGWCCPPRAARTGLAKPIKHRR
ncbi:MAG: DUF2914 domain-containing protein [Anaerolineae bacterium]|nr:DUF2914 domain-containing protein [Anaerolineae bacterium]